MRKQRRARPTKEFCESIAEGAVLAARVHPEGGGGSDESEGEGGGGGGGRAAEPSGEEHHLGLCGRRAQTEKLAWRSGKAQRLGNNVASKNAWAVRFFWLHFRPHLKKAGSAGARACQLVPGEPTVVFPCHAIVCQAQARAAAQKLGRTSGPGAMWLSKAAHEAIMAHPTELLAQCWGGGVGAL